MKKNLLFLAIPLMIVACSCGGHKKVLVITHDKPDIDLSNNTVTCKATRGNEDKELDISGSSLKVSTAAGDATINLPAEGYYVVNLKNNDTIIGSYQHLLSPEEANKAVTQVDLLKKIDSLQLLVQGKNVSDANRNFFILPNTGVKVSDNTGATIVAPYHQMTSFSASEDGKIPEVYKFFTINEVRDIITNLIKLTKPTEPMPATSK